MLYGFYFLISPGSLRLKQCELDISLRPKINIIEIGA